MRDLETMLDSIRDRQSRALFQEAIRSYQAGAYRAAIISIWVAASVDLILKLRAVADVNPGLARNAIAALDSAIERRDIRALQKFEAGLLTLCEKELELLTARERTELERVYEDRNLCAHPSFSEMGDAFAPSAELVRSHLSTVFDAVLAQPAIAGRRLIEIYIAESQGEGWPERDLPEYLRGKYFGRSRPQIQRSLARLILKSCATVPDGVERIWERNRDVALAVNGLDGALFSSVLADYLTATELNGALTDGALARLVGALGSLECFWSNLPGPARARLDGLIAHCEMAFLEEARIFEVTLHPIGTADVDAAIAARLADVDAEAASLLIRAGVSPRRLVDPIIDHAVESMNYADARANFGNVVAVADALDAEHLGRLAEAVRSNNQILPAYGIAELLIQLWERTVDDGDGNASWSTIEEAIETYISTEASVGRRQYLRLLALMDAGDDEDVDA